MEPQTPVAAPQATPPAPTPEHHAMGPLIGTLIILILIGLGGFYFYQMSGGGADQLPLILSDDDREGLPTPSSSDEVANIESDVSMTDLDTLDAQIEADMQAAESAM